MRGKLKVPVGAAVFLNRGRGSAVEFGLTSTGNEKVTASRVRQSAPWIAGVLAVLVASSALPQGNIDAGKSPAQMFADTCSNCHRRPSELKRGASAGFLRQHYTPGAQEASAMASYLAGIPADPRAGKEREKAKAPLEKEKAKAPQQHPQQQVQERLPIQERPKAQQPALKSKRPEIAKSPASEPPAEVPQEVRVEAPPAPPVPKLEPFEE
jgi:mono/diheme cytochrome c family protein